MFILNIGVVYLSLKKEIQSFDDNFEDGIFAIPNSKKLKVRALYEYCKEKGISPNELSEDELKRFFD